MDGCYSALPCVVGSAVIIFSVGYELFNQFVGRRRKSEEIYEDVAESVMNTNDWRNGHPQNAISFADEYHRVNNAHYNILIYSYS